jgi:hypothetical protein
MMWIFWTEVAQAVAVFAAKGIFDHFDLRCLDGSAHNGNSGDPKREANLDAVILLAGHVIGAL